MRGAQLSGPGSGPGLAGRPPKRVRLLPTLAGLVILVGAGTTLVLRSGESQPQPRLLGGDFPINASAPDDFSLEAHNSPSVVANPLDARNLAVVNRLDAPQFGCAVSVSLDGGASWGDASLPAVPGTTIGCFGPDAAFGADGLLHVSFTTFAAVEGRGTVPSAIWLATSRDGGRTFGAPVKAGGPSAFEVRMAADPDVPGRLYLAWVEAIEATRWGFAAPGNPIKVARSDNGGVSWSEPTVASDPARGRVIAPALAVGGGSRVYLAYLDVGDDRLDYSGAHEGRGGEPDDGPWSMLVARSDDLGASWAQAVVDQDLVPVARFLVLFPPTPSIAADPRGSAAYVAFHDGRSGDADVVLWTSSDGKDWRAGRDVPDVGPDDGKAQYLPAVALAPDGRIDVVYYDRRQDPADISNDVSVQSSYDGGRTFAGHVRLTSRSFPSSIGYGNDRGMPELGSRLGIVSTDAGLLAVWADTRAGTPLTGRQDLGKAVVRFDAGDHGTDALRLATYCGLPLGLGLILIGALGGSRRSAPASNQFADPAAEGGHEPAPDEDEVGRDHDHRVDEGGAGADQV